MNNQEIINIYADTEDEFQERWVSFAKSKNMVPKECVDNHFGCEYILFIRDMAQRFGKLFPEKAIAHYNDIPTILDQDAFTEFISLAIAPVSE